MLAQGGNVVEPAHIAQQDAAGDDLALVVDQFIAAQREVAARADQRGRALGDLRAVLGLRHVVLRPVAYLPAGLLVAVPARPAPAFPAIFVDKSLVAIALGLDVQVLDRPTDLDHFRAEMQIGIEQAVRLQRHAAQRFDGGAFIEDEIGAAGRRAVGIQRAADVQRIAAATRAEYQRLFTIVDDAGADIQPLTRGDDGGLVAFLAVAQGAGLDCQAVAIDAAAAQVVDGAGLDAGLAAVDQATIGQRAIRDDAGAAHAAHLAGHAVVDVGAAHLQIVRAHHASVGPRARRADARAAVGRDGLVIGLALPQGEREIALGQQAAVAAHGIRRDIQGAAGKQRTRVIEQLPDIDHNSAAG